MKTPKELRAKYQYMFEGDNIGLSISKGWFPIFSKLCQDIDTLLGPDKRGFHWRQCKEKFGTARWYWAMKGVKPSIRISVISQEGVTEFENKPKVSKTKTASVHITQLIGELIDIAEKKTRSACIVCGEPGELDQHQGYVLLLCPAHKKERRTNELTNPWFTAEEDWHD